MRAFHERIKYKTYFRAWLASYWNLTSMPHWHREIEITVMKGGKAKIGINNDIYRVEKGDVIICDSGDIHYVESEESQMDILIFDIDLLFSTYKNFRFSYPVLKYETIKDNGIYEQINELLEKIRGELAKGDIYYDFITRGNLCVLWGLLLRVHPSIAKDVLAENHRMEMLVELQSLLTYINRNYREDITLEKAAAVLHFSPSYFSKLFKRLTGMNFVNYINVVRVEKAIEELQTTAKKITDIAVDCGFSNVRTFNRVFKEITGQTPTQAGKNKENIPMLLDIGANYSKINVAEVSETAVSYLKKE